MFKYAPEIKVGDVFTRVDKNGKVWKAEVINRTEYFVDVKKTQPYQVRVCDEEPFRQKRFYDGCNYIKEVGGVYHYEDAEPTFERAQINIDYEEYETGRMKKGLFGEYPETAKRQTGKFFIAIKEEYSKSNQYDKIYSIRKNNKDNNWKNFQKSSIIIFSNNKVNYEISSN